MKHINMCQCGRHNNPSLLTTINNNKWSNAISIICRLKVDFDTTDIKVIISTMYILLWIIYNYVLGNELQQTKRICICTNNIHSNWTVRPWLLLIFNPVENVMVIAYHCNLSWTKLESAGIHDDLTWHIIHQLLNAELLADKKNISILGLTKIGHWNKPSNS